MVKPSFGGKWLLAMVGLDLVVIAGCVGLIEEKRKRWKREMGEKREVNYLYYLIG